MMTAGFVLLYALNMYFQSFGAMAIIKVKAYWFHVRERGVFGAIFGTFISVGVYFAFDWGGAIVTKTKVGSSGWLHDLFVSTANPLDATWAVFYIPAIILIFWLILDWWLVKNTPEEAGFPPFDPAMLRRGKCTLNFRCWICLKRFLPAV